MYFLLQHMLYECVYLFYRGSGWVAIKLGLYQLQDHLDLRVVVIPKNGARIVLNLFEYCLNLGILV